MAARRGRIAIVLGPILGLLLLLVARPAPRPAGDIVPAPAATGLITPSQGVSPGADTAGPASPGADSPGPAGSVPRAAGPDRATADGCPSGNAMSGLCGTVAGFTGFYGSWKTAGAAGAFCLQHAKREPAPGLAYTKYPTAAGHADMSGESRLRLGYLLGRYGDTGDATKAAALAILAHASVGDSLTTEQLASFSTSLPAPVRAAAVSLWSEAAADHGPYTVGVAVLGRGGGARATVTVRSNSGQPMAGFAVSWAGSSHGEETTTTAADGTATLTVATVAPGGAVTAHVAVSGLPASDVGIWTPADSSVQTVAVPLSDVTVGGAGSWTAAQAPASLTLVKTTTDQAYVSPRFAVFLVADAAGRPVGKLDVDATGHSNVLGGLTAANGPFTVSELTPCDQCLPAPPQGVSLAPGQAGVVSFIDDVVPVQLGLRKVDATGAALSGAVLHLRRASEPGGAYDTDLGTCTTNPTGCAVPGQDKMQPGDYQVTEDAPAPGTSWSVPRAQTVELVKGSALLTFTDPRLTGVSFSKAADPAAGTSDATHESFAGTVFAVSGPALPTASGADPTVVELGRCTTAADGSCALAGTPLVEGTAYAWREVTAPPGFAIDPSSHPFTACVAPCATGTVTALDQGRYAEVTLRKHVAGDNATGVAGATVDLCATGLPATLAATYPAPPEAACGTSANWVASGVTDAHGGIDFGALPPGVHYCAVERTAPAGFELNPDPVCGDLGPAGAVTDPPPAALALELADMPTPGPTPTVPPVVGQAGASPPPATPVAAPSQARRPAARAAVVRPAPVKPPILDTTLKLRAPAVSPTPLAFTGVEHVGSMVELGAGCLLLGLALLSAARRRV